MLGHDSHAKQSERGNRREDAGTRSRGMLKARRVKVLLLRKLLQVELDSVLFKMKDINYIE